MNCTKIQAVLGLSATLTCALGFATLARAGGGDNDNPYNMPRSLSGGGGNNGGNNNGGGSAGDGTQQQSLAAPGSQQRGPTQNVTPTADKGSKALTSPLTIMPYSVESGGQLKFVSALNATHSYIEVNRAQIKTAGQTVLGVTGATSTFVKALAGSHVAAKNLVSTAQLQGAFEIQPGTAQVIARLPVDRQTALAAISIGTLGSNGTFAVEQLVTVPVTPAGLDLTALAAQWESMPNAAGKTIKVQIGAGEPTLLSTITFPAGTPKPTYRIDTTPTAP